jgi:mevalonate kinase
MESFFHGRSSGLDPLISYLNKPLLIGESGEISIAELPYWHKNGSGALFLVDSGSPGETQPLVDRFMENCKDDDFLHGLQTVYIPAVNACINAYKRNSVDNLYSKMALLSKYQLENFNPMIQQSVKKIWQQGLESGKFILKLCGSGGGGMVIGLTRDFEKVKNELEKFPVMEIHRI